MSERFLIPPNPACVPEDLARRYAVRGPRYTSYPTAPHFQTEVDRDAVRMRWEDGNRAPKPPGLSLYLHIPFCKEHCWFCGCFTTIHKHPEAADPYLESLKREFDLMARIVDPERPVRQIAFGGGTPNFLSPERFDGLMQALRSVWSIAKDAEISVEIDPRTVVDEHVDVWAAHGFNRFSLGVQDFDPGVLSGVHRAQSLEQTRRLVERLRGVGKTAINFDLIYGLPGQTLDAVRHTVETTVEIAPSRIAYYSYAHVPWMKQHQKVLEKLGIPGPEEKLSFFGLAYDKLTEAGYVPVGMDHFARPEDELTQALQKRELHRNFMGYTTRRGLDQIAFGVSGISAVNRTYAQNTKDFERFHESARAGVPSWERGFLLSEEDALRRELIIDLFCNFHLDIAVFERTWKLDFHRHFREELEALQDMETDGIVRVDERAIEVTPLGRAFVRNVCMAFDRYLESDLGARRYSQTV